MKKSNIMQRWFWLLAVWGLIAFLASPTLYGDELVAWEQVLAKGSIANVLALAEGYGLEPWPTVDSVSRSHQLEDTKQAVRERWHAQAKVLATLLETHLQERPRELVVDEIEAWLDLRDAVAGSNESRAPGYVNLLLADALNRVVFVDLTERLIATGFVSSDLEKALERLRAYRIAPEALLAMAEAEKGGPVFAEGERPKASRDLFYRLLAAENHGDLARGLFAAQEDLESTGTHRLLKSADVGKVLSRYWTTDYKINVTLPFLVDYIRRAPAFDVGDRFEEIVKVLDLSEESLARAGSMLNPAPETVSRDVAHLLQQSESGRLIAFAALDFAPSALARLLRPAISTMGGAR